MWTPLKGQSMDPSDCAILSVGWPIVKYQSSNLDIKQLGPVDMSVLVLESFAPLGKSKSEKIVFKFILMFGILSTSQSSATIITTKNKIFSF